MWKPKKLELINLMSHPNTQFNFVEGKATMIYGVNKTDKGQISNGSGKSALLQGIVIALLQDPLRRSKGLGTTDLIRNDQSSAEVKLELLNTVTQETIKIHRTFFSNTKPSEVDVSLNDLPIKSIPRNGQEKYDVRATNQWILDQLQISKEDLLNYYIVSKKQYKPFLYSSDSDKKAVIGRFSHSDLIDPVFDVVNAELSEIEQDIQKQKQLISVNNGKISAYQEQIDSFDFGDKESKRKTRLANGKVELEEKKTLITKYNALLKQQEETLQIYNDRLSNIPQISIDVGKETKLYQQYKNELSKFETELNQVIKKRTIINTNLMGKITCPSCAHEWHPGKDVDIENEKKRSKQADELVVEIEQDIKSVNKDIQDVSVNLKKYQDKQDQRNRIIDQIKSQMRLLDIQSTRDNLANANRAITRYEEAIEELKTITVDPTKQWQDKIDQITKENGQCVIEISKLEVDLFNKKQWTSHFTKFKSHLSNKTIAVIQTLCNEYLMRMNSDITIELEGYKINKDGSVRENITTNIVKNGSAYGNYEKLSSGEEARVIVSTILAQQKLINMNCDKGGLDLCFLDEIIESVDSSGIKGIMDVLNTLKQTIVVITHGTFDQSYPHTVVVEKNNGNSILT